MLGLGMDGRFGRKVQRVLSWICLCSMFAAVLFGIDWGLRIILDASMQEACDQVIPLFRSLVLPSLHASSTIPLTCPHLPLGALH